MSEYDDEYSLKLACTYKGHWSDSREITRAMYRYEFDEKTDYETWSPLDNYSMACVLVGWYAAISEFCRVYGIEDKRDPYHTVGIELFLECSEVGDGSPEVGKQIAEHKKRYDSL